MENSKYRYFRFSTGRFFRNRKGTQQFQILNEDEMLWEDNCDMVSVFYDAASEFYEITDQNVINQLESYEIKKKVIR